MSAELLEFFEPRRAAVRVSELVWVSCPRCGGEVECAGIADAILHARWCGTPVL